FGLLTTKEPDGTLVSKLILLKKLDREQKDKYFLILTACDPDNSDTVNIVVQVQDSNDNKPRFERDSYEVDIPENSPPGTHVLQVKATDADLGINAKVRYGLTAQSHLMYGHIFKMDRESGILYVVGLVDRETSPVYQLGVTAEDMGCPSRTTRKQLIVNLSDDNDNSPKFNKSTYAIRIVENTPAPTKVLLHVTATDLDDGANGDVRYRID
ncbi:hypothetical protein HELRODRAFT_132264, partial [Helobdella robusta]|uniref:Cadherin domain-containing protein n=1 Tax=Helobdella robusta TaxID=6412 RepID=T1EHX6_HELRO